MGNVENKEVAKTSTGGWVRWALDKMVGTGLWRITDWLWTDWLGKGISLMAAFATWVLASVESRPLVPSFLLFLVALAVSLFIANEVQAWRERKKTKQGESLPEPPKRALSPLEERLNIGCCVTPYPDRDSYLTYDVTLPVMNHGPTDCFMVQVCSVNPPLDVQTMPWSLRWEGTDSEFTEIIHEHRKTLHLCRMDLMGEYMESQVKDPRRGRIWFFTLRENKVGFLRVDGKRGLDDLYALRIAIEFCVTARSTEERRMYRIEFRFNQGSVAPQCRGIQPI